MYPKPLEELNDTTSKIIGAAIEVHRHLGPGFLECIYEEALVRELRRRNVHVERQVTIPIKYRDDPIGSCRIDVLVEGDVVVELKAVESLDAIHFAQVRSYLAAGAFEVGLLINFNVVVLRDGVRRIVARESLREP
jgi:GxxExxY protein